MEGKEPVADEVTKGKEPVADEVTKGKEPVANDATKGKEAIIADILQKAEAVAAGLVSDAQNECDATLARVREEEGYRQREAIDMAKKSAEELLARRKTLDDLETRKTELAAKQAVIDAAYEEAIRKTLTMTDHIYREYIGGLISAYAEDDDMVVIAERDSKRLSREWFDELREKLGKRITLSSERHGGKGGIILSGKLSDKNLTFETMIASLREKTLPEVAKKLFK